MCRIFNKFSLSSLVGNATTGAASPFSPAARVVARRPRPGGGVVDELNTRIDDDTDTDDDIDDDDAFAPLRIDAFVRAPFTAHVVNAVRNIVVDIIMITSFDDVSANKQSNAQSVRTRRLFSVRVCARQKSLAMRSRVSTSFDDAPRARAVVTRAARARETLKK